MKQTAISERLNIFADVLEILCARIPFADDRPLCWTIIANPTAGRFVGPSRWKEIRKLLEEYRNKADRNPLRSYPASPSRTALLRGDELGGKGLIPTTGPGHAEKIVGSVIAEAEEETAPFHLIIAAGGDGTNLEVLTGLYRLPQALKSRFAVLRLPLGTGNDGADGWSLDVALDRLIFPGPVAFSRALQLKTAAPGKTPVLAFNILSVGLDAFVTGMTNKMKRYMPGDSYKLWVDIAALFYDRIYRVGELDVNAFDEKGALVKSIREKTLLLAMGVTGKRTYGSHKWILPDERNVCAVKQMPLLRKIALKELFYTGAHVHKPESTLFTAAKVTFQGDNPILAQMDGETLLLKPADFPASIELTEPVIPVLTMAE
ncbi:MAG: diacylglycerol kinase [Treponema sp.]|jgi:diacylglycerol kinase family enzyme|nr:diacylglycerol kinase [Treponema sp.]